MPRQVRSFKRKNLSFRAAPFRFICILRPMLTSIEQINFQAPGLRPVLAAAHTEGSPPLAVTQNARFSPLTGHSDCTALTPVLKMQMDRTDGSLMHRYEETPIALEYRCHIAFRPESILPLIIKLDNSLPQAQRRSFINTVNI
jgi:hypothetical protein